MPITTFSTEDFRAAVLNGFAPGLVPLSLAASLLGVSRTSLTNDAKNNGKLQLVIIDNDGTTNQGITLASLKRELERKNERLRKINETTAEKVRAHIDSFLACNGVIGMEYYKDLMAHFGLNHHLSQDRQHVGRLLGEISSDTYKKEEFLLSTVVVYKTGPNKGEPAGGYWQMVESETGKIFAEKDRDARTQFVNEQRRRIEDYAKRLPACHCEKCVNCPKSAA